ncbi:MAG: hypothetical protein JWL66_1608 [Sphingomonadales bacterium]|nr:hypothetical protein [Sphingomonadales bacterium]
MSLTFFGLTIAAVGIVILFRAGVMEMLLLMMACSLFGGSAAMTLPGGSSIPPSQFAIIFGVARILLPGSGLLKQAGEALRANIFLGLYCMYGVVAAVFAPIVFRDQIWVPALRAVGRWRSLYDTVLLAPSAQNFTVSFYMIGSLIAGLIAYVAMQGKNSPDRYVKMAVVVAWIHITLGVLAAALKGTPFDLFVDFVRNGSYAQTNQTVYGIVRITGIFTEPSAYAGFAFGWFVFLTECWLRDVMPRRTGPAAFAMGLILFCSTSSTAYVSLGTYALMLVLRGLVLPQYFPFRKLLILAAGMVLVIVITSAMAFIFPAAIDLVTKILRSATIDKQDTDSALQRAFWAKSGIRAFIVSNGIGIGPGSFRSSSFATAMLGSVGIFGSTVLVCHILKALKPLRISTYCGLRDGGNFGQEAMISASAAWAAIGVLIPASIAAPTCDPGLEFAIFAAVALALRSGSVAVPMAMMSTGGHDLTPEKT